MSTLRSIRPDFGPADAEFRAVHSTDELKKATHLMLEAFSPDSAAAAWLDSAAVGYPSFRPEHTRIAVNRGELLAALRLTTETIQIGEARLKMGGIGWVATASAYRRRGIAQCLLQDTQAYMRSQGYHVSMLFGIRDFYERVGYVSSLIDYTIAIETTEALNCLNPFAVHHAKPGDIPAMLKLHQRHESQIACTLLRGAAHMQNKWARYPDWTVLRDEHGKAVAYLRPVANGDVLNVYEAGVEELGLSPAVIAVAGEMAERLSLPRVRFHVPPTHPVARCLTQLRSIHEARRERNAGGMMCILDIGETLESMIPEWESAIAASSASDLRTELTLVLNRKNYRIRTNRGAIDVSAFAGRNKLSLTSADLVRILTGYRPIDDLFAVCRNVVSADARLLGRTIFPQRHPFVWKYDQF